MKNCTNCKHAIFDEIWGEYKCVVYKHTVEQPYDVEPCCEHEKGIPKNLDPGKEDDED